MDQEEVSASGRPGRHTSRLHVFSTRLGTRTDMGGTDMATETEMDMDMGMGTYAPRISLRRIMTRIRS